MATLQIDLSSQAEQTAFNLRRWAEVLENEQAARFEGKIETDRHGNLVMSPPPAPEHGGYQFEIGHLLRLRMTQGRVLTECPISTAEGVKAADVAWVSPERLKRLGNKTCFAEAPEICVEVVSPRNRPGEIEEKMLLYLAAGAKEVWIRDVKGRMKFFMAEGEEMRGSRLCEGFPARVQLQ